MHVIVGSGRKAERLASRLANSLIIDRNPESAEALRKKGFRVLNADASRIEVLSVFWQSRLILVDDDNFNLKVAKVAKTLGFEDVIAIPEDESACSLYEKEGIEKICVSIDAALLTLFGRKRYLETPVSAEFEGTSLKDFDPGEDCTVVSVFREGKILHPYPELTLQRGDVLGIVCGKEVRISKNPFDNILVLGREEDIAREAKMLSEKFSANIIFFEKSGDAYACSLDGSSDKIELGEALEMLRKDDELDLIITSLSKKDEEGLAGLVSKFPTLIATGKENYRNILGIVNSFSPDRIISMATAFSRYFGKVKVLLLEEEQLKHFSKFTESGLVVEVSRGNPMVDTIREFKKGYDLVILSLRNDAGNIDREILWRIMLDRTASVLVVD
ncbi:NAD-binding protein [Archaeoglobus neptunius]|uniref:NAD-binding protein n=1 Tax=Archaeoglobus neptunius TaxID=2798580 RepID=UPI001926B8CA